MELDHRGADLHFPALTDGEENNSIAIASNEFFCGWTKAVTDADLALRTLTGARFGSTIRETDTDSCRPSHRGAGLTSEPATRPRCRSHRR
jgi:hypothetical protein